MSRIHQRGRDPWSSRGAPRHYRLPMAKEAGPLRASAIFGIGAALAALGYFAAQLLRGLL